MLDGAHFHLVRKHREVTLQILPEDEYDLWRDLGKRL